jgi:hypothetical protein
MKRKFLIPLLFSSLVLFAQSEEQPIVTNYSVSTVYHAVSLVVSEKGQSKKIEKTNIFIHLIDMGMDVKEEDIPSAPPKQYLNDSTVLKLYWNLAYFYFDTKEFGKAKYAYGRGETGEFEVISVITTIDGKCSIVVERKEDDVKYTFDVENKAISQVTSLPEEEVIFAKEIDLTFKGEPKKAKRRSKMK